MSRLYTYTATVSRFQLVGKIKSYVSLNKSYKGYLKPNWTRNTAEWLQIYWKSYMFNTTIDADIKMWDQLTIDWEIYDVKATMKYTAITIKELQCLIEKTLNE